MKSMNRFIKGSLVALVVAMMFNLGAGFLLPSELPSGAPAVLADHQPGDKCDPNPHNPNYDPFDETCGDGETGKTYDELRGGLSDSPAPRNPNNSEDLINQVANLATKSHRMFAPLINFFAFQIGNFLGTDYVYQGSMGKMLQRIWVISRNLVNIAFVFLLLWMALKEIFAIGQESELRKNLIKFVLLLVLVNFSWLGTKVVLDAANVVTHVVFAIPSGLNAGEEDLKTKGVNIPQCVVNSSDPEKPTTGACVPTAIFAPADSGESAVLNWESKHCDDLKKSYANAYKEDGSVNSDLKSDDPDRKFHRRTSICHENLNFFTYDQNTAVIYLTYGMAKIQNLVNANASNDVVQLSVGILMSLIIQIAYAIALLALFIALVIRMAMLWFFVGFSPFLVLVIWFSGAEDQDFGDFRFGIKEFVNWAFVPAKVGAVLAISFIMIAAGQAADTPTGTLVDNVNSKTGVTAKLLESKSLFSGLDSLQTFIWLLMSVVILWIGVFAVLSKMSIVNKVTERINDYGKATAKLVATSPYWAPILPLAKGGEKASIQSLVKGVDLRDKLAGYKDLDRSDKDLLNLNAKARTVKFDEVMRLMNKPNFDKSHANRIASMYGFNNLAQMMKQERKVLVGAFEKSKGYEKGGDDLFNALDKINKQETTAEKRRDLRKQTKAVKEGVEAGNKKSAIPGTVQPPAESPAKPAPPASPPAEK